MVVLVVRWGDDDGRNDNFFCFFYGGIDLVVAMVVMIVIDVDGGLVI